MLTSAATKTLAAIAALAESGIPTMATITRLLGVVYAVENINFAAIQTKQALQAANLENEAMQMDAALWAVLDGDGFALSPAMQAAGLTWLRKQAKRKDDTSFSWREKEAVKEGAVITWVSAHAEYNPKTGENLYYQPVFEVANPNGESFQYYVGRTGSVEICG